MTEQKYEQKSNIYYQWHNFNEGKVELKTDLCYALDMNDLKLLEVAYKAARKAISGNWVGRHKLDPVVADYRDDATSLACVYVAKKMDISFSNAWQSYFPDKFAPAVPITLTPPETIVTEYCRKIPEVRSHINKLAEKEPAIRQYLTDLLPPLNPDKNSN